MKRYVQKLISLCLALAALSLLQACSSGASPGLISTDQGSKVAQAFESSGTIAVGHYDRSIFSTSNF